jgi:RecA-family ATPase
MENAISERSGGLAVVDSFTTIRGTNRGDFVKQEYDALRIFSEITVRTRCTIILVHHHSKGQHEDTSSMRPAEGNGCET